MEDTIEKNEEKSKSYKKKVKFYIALFSLIIGVFALIVTAAALLYELGKDNGCKAKEYDIHRLAKQTDSLKKANASLFKENQNLKNIIGSTNIKKRDSLTAEMQNIDKPKIEKEKDINSNEKLVDPIIKKSEYKAVSDKNKKKHPKQKLSTDSEKEELINGVLQKLK